MRPHDGVYWVWVQQSDHQPYSSLAHLMGLPVDPLVMRLVCRAKIYRFKVCVKIDPYGNRNVYIPESHAMCLGCMGMWVTQVYAGLVHARDIPTEYEGGDFDSSTSD